MDLAAAAPHGGTQLCPLPRGAGGARGTPGSSSAPGPPTCRSSRCTPRRRRRRTCPCCCWPAPPRGSRRSPGRCVRSCPCGHHTSTASHPGGGHPVSHGQAGGGTRTPPPCLPPRLAEGLKLSADSSWLQPLLPQLLRDTCTTLPVLGRRLQGLRGKVVVPPEAPPPSRERGATDPWAAPARDSTS